MKPTKLPPPTFSSGPTLVDFLEKIMPKIKTHADRMKLYRKFLYEQHLEHDYNNNDVDFFNGPAIKLTPEEAEKKAADAHADRDCPILT